MALGARSTQQGLADSSLCQPLQARIYRSLPSSAEASRGEPSPVRSPVRPRWPTGAPARPLHARRIYCTRRPPGALCKSWICPQRRRRVPSHTHPFPPGQCATPWTKRVLKPRRALPGLREGKPELGCSWVKDGAGSRQQREERNTKEPPFFLRSFLPLGRTRAALKNGC